MVNEGQYTPHRPVTLYLSVSHRTHAKSVGDAANFGYITSTITRKKNHIIIIIIIAQFISHVKSFTK